jgi:hypothetical protein
MEIVRIFKEFINTIKNEKVMVSWFLSCLSFLLLLLFVVLCVIFI